MLKKFRTSDATMSQRQVEYNATVCVYNIKMRKDKYLTTSFYGYRKNKM